MCFVFRKINFLLILVTNNKFLKTETVKLFTNNII